MNIVLIHNIVKERHLYNSFLCYTEGETSVSFNVNQGTTLMADAELALTPYGLEYLTLRRLVVISIRSAGECR